MSFNDSIEYFSELSATSNTTIYDENCCKVAFGIYGRRQHDIISAASTRCVNRTMVHPTPTSAFQHYWREYLIVAACIQCFFGGAVT